MKEKIVIIGAGAVGCYLAQQLKKYGLEPLLIEEHEEVGRPLHCTGVIGSDVFNQVENFTARHPSVVNSINGATVYFNGDSFDIERKNSAYIVDREKFDKALSCSLNILYSTKFLGFEREGSGYVIETDKEELAADIIIGADGADSSVRKALGESFSSNIKYYKGFQLRVKSALRRSDFVQVYIEKSFFSWIVPETEGMVRVGVISDNPHHDLQALLKKTKLDGQEVIEKFGGLMTVGVCPETAKENIVLVGGAACQVKPLTFGGIYFGLKAAKILAACIRDGRLDNYDRLWKSELGAEIKIGIKLREVYERLEVKELERIFNFLKSKKEIIERFADFENHSSFFRELIKNPKFYPEVGDLFGMFLKAVI